MHKKKAGSTECSSASSHKKPTASRNSKAHERSSKIQDPALSPNRTRPGASIPKPDDGPVHLAALCLTHPTRAVLQQLAGTVAQSKLLLRHCEPARSKLKAIAASQPHIVLSDHRRCAACRAECPYWLSTLSRGSGFILVNQTGEEGVAPLNPVSKAVFHIREQISLEGLEHALRELRLTLAVGQQSEDRGLDGRVSCLDLVHNWEELAKEALYGPAKLASLCDITPRQLQRFFRSHFRATPGKWLLRLRCRLARGLIEQGYSDKAVVADLHFTDVSHLCHAFDRLYRCPPRHLVRAAGQIEC